MLTFCVMTVREYLDFGPIGLIQMTQLYSDHTHVDAMAKLDLYD